MNCQPSLQLSPPRSLVTQPLRPLTPSDELPQHTKWHRQQDSSSSTPETQASSSNSSSTAPNLDLTGSNSNLKLIVKSSCSSHPILGLEVQNSLLRKWLSAKQLDDVMAMLSSGDFVR